MKVQWNSKAWALGVRRYGKFKMVAGLVTLPLWLPAWAFLMLVSFLLQCLGAFGELIERWINP